MIDEMIAKVHACTSAQIVVPCDDLDASLAFFCEHLGFRLDMIMPADAPRIALVSGHGLALRLETSVVPLEQHTPITLRLIGDAAQWSSFESRILTGPGGMRIELIDRDATILIPDGSHEFVIRSLR